VYVGANDFALPPATMPLDLVEHEMGHSLGLPHSGDVIGAAGNAGAGPYDLMGDPASPRAVEPSRRDGPDLIAIDRFDLGWLPADAVAVGEDGDRVVLHPSGGEAGVRMLVLPIDDHRALTVELLTATGFDDHLPADGVVVHLVDDSPAWCGATRRCAALERRQQVAGTSDGSTLLSGGTSLHVLGWNVSVTAVADATATVRVERRAV
jgi:hypothetical protein